MKKTARPRVAVQSSASLSIDETCRFRHNKKTGEKELERANMRLAVLGSLAAVAATVVANDQYEHEDDFNNEDYIPE